MQTVFVIDEKQVISDNVEKVERTEDGVEIPNFRPVEFDGTRLDLKKSHQLILTFDTKTDREICYQMLKELGYNPVKNDEYE